MIWIKEALKRPVLTSVKLFEKATISLLSRRVDNIKWYNEQISEKLKDMIADLISHLPAGVVKTIITAIKQQSITDSVFTSQAILALKGALYRDEKRLLKAILAAVQPSDLEAIQSLLNDQEIIQIPSIDQEYELDISIESIENELKKAEIDDKIIAKNLAIVETLTQKTSIPSDKVERLKDKLKNITDALEYLEREEEIAISEEEEFFDASGEERDSLIDFIKTELESADLKQSFLFLLNSQIQALKEEETGHAQSAQLLRSELDVLAQWSTCDELRKLETKVQQFNKYLFQETRTQIEPAIENLFKEIQEFRASLKTRIEETQLEAQRAIRYEIFDLFKTTLICALGNETIEETIFKKEFLEGALDLSSENPNYDFLPELIEKLTSQNMLSGYANSIEHLATRIDLEKLRIIVSEDIKGLSHQRFEGLKNLGINALKFLALDDCQPLWQQLPSIIGLTEEHGASSSDEANPAGATIKRLLTNPEIVEKLPLLYAKLFEIIKPSIESITLEELTAIHDAYQNQEGNKPTEQPKPNSQNQEENKPTEQPEPNSPLSPQMFQSLKELAINCLKAPTENTFQSLWQQLPDIIGLIEITNKQQPTVNQQQSTVNQQQSTNQQQPTVNQQQSTNQQQPTDLDSFNQTITRIIDYLAQKPELMKGMLKATQEQLKGLKPFIETLSLEDFNKLLSNDEKLTQRSFYFFKSFMLCVIEMPIDDEYFLTHLSTFCSLAQSNPSISKTISSLASYHISPLIHTFSVISMQTNNPFLKILLAIATFSLLMIVTMASIAHSLNRQMQQLGNLSIFSSRKVVLETEVGSSPPILPQGYLGG